MKGTDMRVKVNEDICQGHTMCHLVAPQIFKLRDEDGHSYVESEEVPPGLEAVAQMGADNCPERAIEVTP